MVWRRDVAWLGHGRQSVLRRTEAVSITQDAGGQRAEALGESFWHNCAVSLGDLQWRSSRSGCNRTPFSLRAFFYWCCF